MSQAKIILLNQARSAHHTYEQTELNGVCMMRSGRDGMPTMLWRTASMIFSARR